MSLGHVSGLHRARSSRRGSYLGGVLFLLAATTQALPDDPPRGEQLYRNRCAGCHGAAGEGVKDKYPNPLVGDRSVLQLARYIEKNMPEDDPGSVKGEDALEVARHVHETFYSPIAQARHRAPRIEPARFTARQIRNVAADLVGAFREAPDQPGEELGLRGEYFDSREPRGKPALTRLDPQVLFQFGRETPNPEGVGAAGFAARWSGSLLAEDTGEYELVVRSDQAVRLWINGLDRPLIDAWVKSGSDTDFRARIHLLGGRLHPVRLEMSSRKQGVDDSAKQKTPPPPVETLLELCWKPPRGVLEPIPARRLRPVSSPQLFVLTTPFPPDDRSVGFERGASFSAAWDNAVTEAAIETASHLVRNLDALSSAWKATADKKERVRSFLLALAERAFRRPLEASERALYVDRQLAKPGEIEEAVTRSVILIFKSPRFLWLEPGGRPVDAYTVASRLSFALWDSLPDAELLRQAASNGLSSREQVVEQAERMLLDPRARAKARQFLHHWLNIELAPDLMKDSHRFPDFGEALAADLRASLDLFLESTLWSPRSDFRDLLLSRSIFVNGRLGQVYGIDAGSSTSFRPVELDPGRAAGLLSHPYLMARFAYSDVSSPIHRGVFLVRSVLGRGLRPPPEAAAPLPPSLHPGLTTRERVSLQTSPKPCQGCHEMINPLGFALERFDAMGRLRSEEQGKPIDDVGYFEARSGERRTFRGARELAEILAASEEVHASFVQQLFHNYVRQPILAHGVQTPSELLQIFARSGYNMQKLIVEVAATAALVGLPYRGSPELLRKF